MKLDSKQCEAVLAVLDGGSFEQAAARLHLTSSAVSQRVRALEQVLGSVLVVRGRPCRATHAGQRLLQYLRRAQLLEQDLQAEFAGEHAQPLSIALAVNADSLASWFLPALAQFLLREQVLLDLTVDDQDHTYMLLEAGLALGCISTEAHPMRGCVAEPLGVMRYRCMASPEFRKRWFARGMTRTAARRAPVVVFNRKDKLQADFLLQHLGLPADAYPCHYIPASEPYMQAICLGLGWGMLPEVQMRELQASGALADLMPDRPTDVGLYWHRWKVQSPRLERMSATLIQAARQVLA
ncbi:LysR family transcriptional regulator ArgP [Undibacterium arcticum]|uniref:LysR family transcriptional regulator ArgP n=1 Tax=Undibacterium arcticum TaxID=1762892 RepID=A0ABV7EYK0_9BURK